MSNDQNSVMVGNVGEVGFTGTPYRPEYNGGPHATPIMDASRSASMSPQILVLMLSAAIKRCWKWALLFGLILGALGAATAWITYPKKYVSTAWIHALPTQQYVVFKEGAGDSSITYQAFLQSQYALIKSPPVLRAVLDNPQVAMVPKIQKQKDRQEWLRKNIQLGQFQKSDYFTIAFTADNPDHALAVTQAITNQYTERFSQNSSSVDSDLIKSLNLEKTVRTNLVKTKQKELKAMLEAASKLSESAVSANTDLIGGMAQANSIVKEYILAEARLVQLQAEKEAIEQYKNEEMPIPDILIKDAIVNDPGYTQLTSLIRYLESQIESKGRSLTDKDPVIVALRAELGERKVDLEALSKQLVTTKKKELAERLRLEVERGGWEKDALIRSQEILVKTLKSKVESQSINSQQLATETADISFHQVELARETKVLDMLSERLVALETEKSAPARISVVEHAQRPEEPDLTTRLPLVIMAGGALFLLPFVLGIAVEMVRPRLYHVSQVRKAVPGVIIGEIMEPPVAWLHGSAFRRRLARYRESVHNWCTHLLLADPFRHCQTLAVASVAGDDGKTFLAIQIAAAMAQMKSGPVLLIDGDMRVGRLHLLFGNEEPGPGLADVLSFRKGIGEAVVLNEKEPNLHLLSAGNLDVSPYELLGDGRFRELLDTLSTHYSLIMVVVPPVSHAAESLMMAASVDSVILCVRQASTVLAAMEDVYRKLVNTGSRIDGIVVKDIPYYQMAGKDGGFSDKIEQIRLAHLLQTTE